MALGSFSLVAAFFSLFVSRLNCAEPFTYLRFIYYAQQPWKIDEYQNMSNDDEN